jgi:hypothetical protein
MNNPQNQQVIFTVITEKRTYQQCFEMPSAEIAALQQQLSQHLEPVGTDNREYYSSAHDSTIVVSIEPFTTTVCTAEAVWNDVKGMLEAPEESNWLTI